MIIGFMDHGVLVADPEKQVVLSGLGNKRKIGFRSPVAWFRNMRCAGNDLDIVRGISAREDFSSRNTLNRSSERPKKCIVGFFTSPAGQRG